jgi:hypothetical protein
MLQTQEWENSDLEKSDDITHLAVFVILEG